VVVTLVSVQRQVDRSCRRFGLVVPVVPVVQVPSVRTVVVGTITVVAEAVAERVQPMRRSQGVKDKSRILTDQTVLGSLLLEPQAVEPEEMATLVVH